MSSQHLHAYYGESHVLHGLDLNFKKGELVSFLGRNGAGKTSLLRAIMGTLITRKGKIFIDDQRVDSWASFKIARLGVGYIPEECGIYSCLSVYENLVLPPVLKPGGLSLSEIYSLFPNLADRGSTPGTKLSGGEQQMLAIARVLRAGADVILLDEPTEGRAPGIVMQIGAALNLLKSRGRRSFSSSRGFHLQSSSLIATTSSTMGKSSISSNAPKPKNALTSSPTI